LLVAPDGQDGALRIHQDARLYSAILDEGEQVSHALVPGRGAWLQVARGRVTLNETTLEAGDGAQIENETTLTITGGAAASEILLFDLA
jgi:redox-sensitive bicupin YhaK (pirin superfamily)